MPPALQFLVLTFAGWVNRHQDDLIDYLREENRVLREHLGPRPLRLTDAQRRRLAVRGHKLGRRVLTQVAGIVTPDTIQAAASGVVARIVTGPHDAHRQDPHLPIRYDTGQPSSVIRLRISQPRTTSLPCPVGLRARRPSPMMDLYRKNVFSTRL